MSDDTDELIADMSVGMVQNTSITAEEALEQLERLMSQLDIDRRTSMPNDPNSLEYRLRDAHANLQGVERELKAEAGYD